MAHLERAVYSTEDHIRHQSTGIVMWIDEWFSGMIETRHAPAGESVEEPTDNSYLESDGLEIEIHESAYRLAPYPPGGILWETTNA